MATAFLRRTDSVTRNTATNDTAAIGARYNAIALAVRNSANNDVAMMGASAPPATAPIW
ncbi:hypothetical protein AB0K15_17605 [Amycolatopsis sp. NPDC049253]|uniref:hypothetical protein n=1 Tax=Amycolatopsis sp. NPDC049253 TaxID=3155274 RepID=UPI00342CC15A